MSGDLAPSSGPDFVDVQLPEDVSDPEFMTMNAYQLATRRSDRMPVDSLDMPLLGLFGEIGSLLSELRRSSAISAHTLSMTRQYWKNWATRCGISASSHRAQA